MLSAEAGIQLQHMRKGTMREEDWTRLASTMGRISDAPLFIDDSPNMSLMEIRAKCRRLKQRNNLKLVVIDYLQLMTSGKRVESRQQEVSEFSRQIKLLAKELDIPVVAISQLNRGSEQRTDKKPQLSDLRESGSIEQDADIVLFIYREDYYLAAKAPAEDHPDFAAWQEEMGRAYGRAEVIVAKQRHGATGKVKLKFDAKITRFSDHAEADYLPEMRG